MVRQLAAEELVARNRSGKRRVTAENVVFPEVGWLRSEADVIHVRSVSKGKRPVMTVDRERPDLFGKLATILRESGAPAAEAEGEGNS